MRAFDIHWCVASGQSECQHRKIRVKLASFPIKTLFLCLRTSVTEACYDYNK